jgi:hypothetical protein
LELSFSHPVCRLDYAPDCIDEGVAVQRYSSNRSFEIGALR